MITVQQAEQIIQANTQNYGIEVIPFELALGRVLAEDLVADRDLPPYNRSTMDGIAIKYAAFESGCRSFRVKGTMAAGNEPIEFGNDDECVEIMTGAALPDSADTIIRYEDIEVAGGMAQVKTNTIKKGQNIHPKGKDKKQGDAVTKAPCIVDAVVIGIAASVGLTMLKVKQLPKTVIISTGDELVDIENTPGPYQVRKSNSYTFSAILKQHGIEADLLHITDDLTITKEKISNCLEQYDVIILSGGISMGKFDYVPQALEELGVTKLFHKVQQRPGKPFWFGKHELTNTMIFAFPGNPVSGFLCLYRYFIPWLQESLGIKISTTLAALNADVSFPPPLQYFIQVALNISPAGQLLATPVEGNGSGDFGNLVTANAFMELPAEQTNFAKGELHKVWPFKPII